MIAKREQLRADRSESSNLQAEAVMRCECRVDKKKVNCVRSEQKENERASVDCGYRYNATAARRYSILTVTVSRQKCPTTSIFATPAFSRTLNLAAYRIWSGLCKSDEQSG